MMMEIKNLTKRYEGGKLATDQVSFAVGAGEIVGFIGHNGAGKTTTLSAIAGIIDFEGGEILIGDKSMAKEPVACKQMTAFVPDTPTLYGYLTGYQYLNFICDLYQVPADVRSSRISLLAEKFEIAHALGDLISSYSHGMQQKVALMGAFIHEPTLLILDEPFVALDPKAFITLKELMSDLCQRGGAVLFSSHVLDVVEKLCHKLVVIRQGKIIAQGAIEGILGNKSLESVFMEMTQNG